VHNPRDILHAERSNNSAVAMGSENLLNALRREHWRILHHLTRGRITQ
jgi:hypothetical protein